MDRAAPAAANQPGGPAVTPLVGPVILNRDLRDLPYIAPNPEVEEKRLTRYPHPEIPSPAGPNPSGFERFESLLKQIIPPTPMMPGPILTFDGMNSAQSRCLCLPPDTDGDVGPNHYVQSVNSSIKIFDKNGNPLNGPNETTYNSFFLTPRFPVQARSTNASAFPKPATRSAAAGFFTQCNMIPPTRRGSAITQSLPSGRTPIILQLTCSMVLLLASRAYVGSRLIAPRCSLVVLLTRSPSTSLRLVWAIRIVWFLLVFALAIRHRWAGMNSCCLSIARTPMSRSTVSSMRLQIPALCSSRRTGRHKNSIR